MFTEFTVKSFRQTFETCQTTSHVIKISIKSLIHTEIWRVVLYHTRLVSYSRVVIMIGLWHLIRTRARADWLLLVRLRYPSNRRFSSTMTGEVVSNAAKYTADTLNVPFTVPQSGVDVVQLLFSLQQLLLLSTKLFSSCYSNLFTFIQKPETSLTACKCSLFNLSSSPSQLLSLLLKSFLRVVLSVVVRYNRSLV